VLGPFGPRWFGSESRHATDIGQSTVNIDETPHWGKRVAGSRPAQFDDIAQPSGILTQSINNTRGTPERCSSHLVRLIRHPRFG